MRRLFALLMIAAMIGGSFGPAFAGGLGSNSPCTPATIEQCVVADASAIIVPAADNGGCGLKAIGAQGSCPMHDPRIIRMALNYAERALLPAFLSQPKRPPKHG